MPLVPGTLTSITVIVMLQVLGHPPVPVTVSTNVYVPAAVGVNMGALLVALFNPVVGDQE